jgi:hypothetical protein
MSLFSENENSEPENNFYVHLYVWYVSSSLIIVSELIQRKNKRGSTSVCSLMDIHSEEVTVNRLFLLDEMKTAGQ